MEWALFLGSIAPGMLFMVFAWYFNTYPPKSINFIYGYRTRKSMRNQETWDFANGIGAKMMFYVGLSTLIVGTAGYVISAKWAMGISIFFLVIAVFVGIFWCERQLEVNFDKNGNPVNHVEPSN
ncbi:SdpI family protein [Arenibacter sp. F20364]|uniref:SdpI family protein n=1 Tax=Arenibacter sp. F20364 TaxID=2926415 RepID=UPI0032B1C2ED